MSLKNSALALAAVLSIALPAFAQTSTATITGRVEDATGLSVPGVTVTLQGDDIRQMFTTEVDGRYRFLDLAPGSYKLTSELDGFRANVREHVIVVVGQTVDLPVTLVLGALTETVIVTARVQSGGHPPPFRARL